MNHTIFLEKHKEHNAKLVDFAGWEMPINYPDGIIKESNFVRDDAGMFDVSHMGRVEISGKNSRDLIQKNVTDKHRFFGGINCKIYFINQ